MPPQIVLLWLLMILSCQHLKNSKRRERFSLYFSYLLQNTASKRNSSVLNPLPRSFINQGRWTLITGEKTGNHTTPGPTWSQTLMPPICSSKSPFIFPKIHLLSPHRPTSLLFPLLSSQISQLFWIFTFFPVMPLCTRY